MDASRDIGRLLEIMAALRAPGTGCSWDLAQTAASIVPYTIEETYEVADAVDRGDRDDLKEELGDLLLQVVFQAQIAEEEGSFDFGAVVDAITTKLIRRHPHIFGAKRDLTEREVKDLWAALKAAEKLDRSKTSNASAGEPQGTVLAGVPAGLPPLLRAEKLQRKAATVGFDWNDARLVLAKIREEIDEIEQSLDDRDAVGDEVGDLLFAAVNLARHLGVDPEAALRGTNRKFERRFAFVEKGLEARGTAPRDASLQQMEDLWQEAKKAEPKISQAERRNASPAPETSGIRA